MEIKLCFIYTFIISQLTFFKNIKIKASDRICDTYFYLKVKYLESFRRIYTLSREDIIYIQFFEIFFNYN